MGSPTRIVTMVVVVFALVSPVGASAHEVPRVSAIAPGSGTLLGAYVQPSGWSQAQQKAAVTGLETDLGRKLAISQLFYKWGAAFPTWKESWDVENGRVPMVTWQIYSTTSITAGTQDAWLRERADAVANFGEPMLLRWGAEMDAGFFDDVRGTAANYIAAWRHIHDVFEAEGATNAEWVWCPNASAFASGEAQTYYPGDAYVDWICADGYNWAPRRGSWEGFMSIFGAFETWASSKGKPSMIAETGALEGAGEDKARWIDDMHTSIEASFPSLRALVYFDAVGSSFQGGTFDWRVDTSASSFSAFRRLAQDPHFNPGAPPPSTPPPSSTSVRFSDRFESGGLSRWSNDTGYVRAQRRWSSSGSWGVRLRARGSPALLVKQLRATTRDLYVRADVRPSDIGHNVMNLIRLRTSTGKGIASVFLTKDGRIAVYNDVSAHATTGAVSAQRGHWQTVVFHLRIAGSSSTIEVWLDGQRIDALGMETNLGSAAIAQLQLGDHVDGRRWDVAFDAVRVSDEQLT